MLTRYDDVTAAALDCEAFTSAVPGTTLIPPTQPREDPLLPLELDPPEHSVYRALVNPLFAKPRIDAMRPDLEALATRLLEPIVRNGGGDVMAEFAHPMSLGSLARLMNLPEERRGPLVRLGRADVLERHPRQRRSCAGGSRG